MTVVINGTTGITSPAESLAGNLTFTSTGNRITGDFSNATVANRVMFQTTTAASPSRVGVIPNGTTTAELFVANAETPTNAQVGTLTVTSTEVRVQSTAYGTGTGSYLPMAFYTGGSERVRVDTSGNVGIGTSSPTAKVDLGFTYYAGTPTTLSQLIPNISLISSGGAPLYGFGISTSALNITAGEPTGTIRFWTGGVNERMRIDASGNLLINTTTAYAKVVSRTTSAATLPFWASSNYAGDLSAPCMRADKYDNNTTTSQVFLNFSVAANTIACGQINANGAGASAFGSWSDARLKENVVDLPPQLDNILALRPVEFDYIASEGGGSQVGFIAQEMQSVYPDAVGQRAPDNMLTITGWSKTEARLVKAIQELKAELDAVKAQLENK